MMANKMASINSSEYKELSNLVKPEILGGLTSQFDFLQQNTLHRVLVKTSQKILDDYLQKKFNTSLKTNEINHLFRKYVESFQKQTEKSLSLQSQLEIFNKQAGLESMEATLKNLREYITYDDLTKDVIKKQVNQYIEKKTPLFHKTMEQGLASIAQNYVDSSVEQKSTQSADQNKGLNKLSSTFIDSFKALPSPVQTFLLWILCQVFLGAITDYAKEKTLSQIYGMESYILSLNEDKPISKQKLTQENKDIQWEDLNNFRAITGDNVRLHVSPSLNSEVIECIGKNTIVAILDKKDRQWLFVQVKSGDEFITGWITRTYTKPLKA